MSTFYSPQNLETVQLVSKISHQALEIGDLKAQLDSTRRDSNHKLDFDFDKQRQTRSNSVSDTAQRNKLEKQHAQQLDALQKQLDNSEYRFSEHIKMKKKLLQDMEAKSREAKFFEKQCNELQSENQSLKAQIESTLRVTNMSSVGKNRPRGIRQNSLQSSQSVGVVSHNISHSEFETLKSTLEVSQHEIDRFRERETQHKLRIKVLEDALEFRSEEIGLSGHSDLLAKVAHLRGEVTALKNELLHKESRLEQAEENKYTLSSQRDELQKQISKVQQRLAQTQQETHRLRNNDLGALLKEAERERDSLLTFVQKDSHRNSELSKQVEKLESDLRMATKREALAQQKLDETAARLQRETEKSNRLDSELFSESVRVKELVHASDLQRAEKESVERLLERKSLEAEELNRIQLNLFTQLKSREEEVSVKNEVVNSLKTKLQEAEVNVPALTSENKALRQRLSFSENESLAMRDSLSSLEPRLARIEPEYTTLKAERDEWRREKTDLWSELSRLRLVEKLLSELSSDLEQLSQLDETTTLFRSSGQSPSSSGGLQSSERSTSNSNSISLSQQHSAWIGLPSIRNLHPALYDRIRSLASDLHRKESLCRELQIAFATAQNDLQRVERESSATLQHLSHSQTNNSLTIAELNTRVRSAEEDAVTHRTAKITLDQIRGMLKSYPGSLQSLYPHNSPNKSNNLFSSPSASNTTAKQGSPSGSQDQFLSEIPDSLLPDLIGRALHFNSSAVISYSEVQAKYLQLQQEHDSLSVKHSLVVRERNDLDNRLVDTQDKLSAAQDKLDDLQHECAEKTNEAIDLAEAQNALTVTYNASMERAKRELQLKSAHVTTLAQREESVRSKLFGALAEYAERSGQEHPQDPANIHHLVEYAEDVIRHCSTAGSHQFAYLSHFSQSARKQSKSNEAASSYDFLSSAPLFGYNEHAQKDRASATAWVSPEKSSSQAVNSAQKRRERTQIGAQQQSHVLEDAMFNLNRSYVPTHPTQYGFRTASHGAAAPPPPWRGSSPGPKKSNPIRQSPPGDTRSSPSADETRQSRVNGRSSSRMRSNSESGAIHDRLARAKLALTVMRE